MRLKQQDATQGSGSLSLYLEISEIKKRSHPLYVGKRPTALHLRISQSPRLRVFAPARLPTSILPQMLPRPSLKKDLASRVFFAPKLPVLLSGAQGLLAPA